jgi:hypothetical protein
MAPAKNCWLPAFGALVQLSTPIDHSSSNGEIRPDQRGD